MNLVTSFLSMTARTGSWRVDLIDLHLSVAVLVYLRLVTIGHILPLALRLRQRLRCRR